MHDLRRVATWLLVGLGFQVLDITIEGVDIVPDVLGAVFIAVGAFVLAGSPPGERRERAAGLVQVLAVLAVVGAIAESAASDVVPWYVLTAMLFAAIADVFFERCEALGLKGLARRWAFNRNLTLFLEVSVALVVGWVLALVVAEEFAVLVLAGLWPFVHRVVLLFAVRRASVAIVTAEPAPGGAAGVGGRSGGTSGGA